MFLQKEVESQFDDFAKAAFGPGKLDAKTKQLIACAVAISIDCAPCLKSHYNKATEAGATGEEIAEALAIAMAMAAGSKRAKYAPVVQELRGS